MLLGVFGGHTVSSLKKAQARMVDLKARHEARMATLQQLQESGIESALADRQAAISSINTEIRELVALKGITFGAFISEL